MTASFLTRGPEVTRGLNSGCGDLRRLRSCIHSLFVGGNEHKVPFEVDELLAAVAPRHTLLVTPQHDADSTYTDMARAIDKVAGSWPQGKLVRIADAEGMSSFSEFGRVQIDALVAWVGNVSNGQ